MNMAVGEIVEEEEATPLISSPGPNLKKNRSVRTKVPEAELHVYKQGKGPIDVYKTSLGGWDQDQLEVREILDKYGFKSIYAFSPGSGRGVPIRFNQRNGRSLLTYSDGALIYIDGEPKVKHLLFSSNTGRNIDILLCEQLWIGFSFTWILTATSGHFLFISFLYQFNTRDTTR